MATSNDLSELASLLKLERKQARKARRAADASRDMREEITELPAALSPEPERFADYFRPWREYRAPDASDLALFRNAVKDAAPIQKAATADLQRAKPKPIAAQRTADELAA
ncbi:MAG TPA: hypothetical protein PK586_08250, partial [Casimicrobium sp.]|nr:hypothetical protein [Casimicrobium sp.]